MFVQRGLLLSLITHIAMVILAIAWQFIKPKPKYVDYKNAIEIDMSSIEPSSKSLKADDANPLNNISITAPETETPEKEAPQEVDLESVKTENVLKETTSSENEKTPPKAQNDSIVLNKKTDKKTNSETTQNKKTENQKVKQAQLEALNKLKKLSAIEKIKSQVNAEKSQKAQSGQQVIPRGTALVGLNRLESAEFLAQVDLKIKNQWRLPQWLIGKPFKTKVVIYLNANGELHSKKIMQSSGNATYDDYCLKAIENAAPFPTVPEKFVDLYRYDGILIGFPE